MEEVRERSAPEIQAKGDFDKVVLAVIGVVALLLALLIWRGDRAGVGITARSPAANAREVSGLGTIRVTFGQSMDTATVPDLRLSPSVTGAVRWEDDTTLALRPSTPLFPDTTYTVRLEGNLQSASGRAAGRARQPWQFTTRSPRVLFLGWDEQGRVQVHIADRDGGTTRRLTEATMGVQGYAPGADGQSIIFSALREDGGSDLWRAPVDGGDEAPEAILLLDCEGDACSGPTWTADGERLVYERRVFFNSDAPPGPPRLWWLDSESGATTPLFSDDQLLGHSARFSDDGRWLSYVVPLERAMQFYDFETGDVVRLDHETGEPAAWHPWRPELALSNITYQGESFSVHLFHLTLPDGVTTNLSGDAVTNDAAPSWSPDGRWIAFGRKIPRAPVGRQLWLMRADGSELTMLTDDLDRNFGPPAWSPDGTQLLAQRFDIQQPDSDPGIWLVDVDDGALHAVAPAGYAPSWLP